MEVVGVNASHEILVEVDDNDDQIVGNPTGISGQQARPNPIQVLKNMIFLVT
jgi:hypothetical protein